MRRSVAALASVLLAGGLLGMGAAPAQAAPYCGQVWGSQTKQVAEQASGTLTGVRSGRHQCFDRLVLDVSGDLDGYYVSYTDKVTQDGSGEPVPLRGGAALVVAAYVPAPETEPFFFPTHEMTNVSGYKTFRQVAWAGSFEGQSTLGLGVRSRLPFRAFILDGPGGSSRLVVDVAHRW